MKKENPLKKFFCNKKVTIAFSLLAAGFLFVYVILNYNIGKIDLSVSKNDEEYHKTINNYNTLKTSADVAMIVFSVFVSSLISALIIEKDNSNTIVEEVFIGDFFTSNEFIGKLKDEDQLTIFKHIAQNLNFDGCKEKSEMYTDFVEKINNPIFENDLYFEKYYLKATCEIKDEYIEKKFIKSIQVKSFKKSESIDNYKLLSVSYPILPSLKSVEVSSLKIDGETIPLSKMDINIKKSTSSFDESRGYTEEVTYSWPTKIDFSNKKSKKIEIEYLTRCPKNDNVYTCRLACPCKSFDFQFLLKNNSHRINTNAFGFIDDASNSPNLSGDKQNVAIKFDDWIYPLDGVCVYLEKNVAK